MSQRPFPNHDRQRSPATIAGSTEGKGHGHLRPHLEPYAPGGGMVAGAVAEVAGVPVAVAICGFLVMAIALTIAVALPRVQQLE